MVVYISSSCLAVPSDEDRRYLQAGRPRWSKHEYNTAYANEKGKRFLLGADRPWEKDIETRPKKKKAKREEITITDEEESIVISSSGSESESEEEEGERAGKRKKKGVEKGKGGKGGEKEKGKGKDKGQKEKDKLLMGLTEGDIRELLMYREKYQQMAKIVTGTSSEVPGVPSRKEIKKGQTVCVICNKNCGDTTKLRNHTDRWHAGKTKYRCMICKNRSFTNQKNLQDHLKLHDEEADVLPCPHIGCPSTFTTTQALKKHEKLHNIKKSDGANCRFQACQKWFRLKAYCTEHEEICIHNPNPTWYKCLYCPEKYRSRKLVNRHMKKDHGWGK